MQERGEDGRQVRRRDEREENVTERRFRRGDRGKESWERRSGTPAKRGKKRKLELRGGKRARRGQR